MFKMQENIGIKQQIVGIKYQLLVQHVINIFLIIMLGFAGRAIYVLTERQDRLENRVEQYEILVDRLYGENGG